jgi:hypothetical protein
MLNLVTDVKTLETNYMHNYFDLHIQTDERTDGRTDGRTDRRTDEVIPIYPPELRSWGV